jgi:hypothetical protein
MTFSLCTTFAALLLQSLVFGAQSAAASGDANSSDHPYWVYHSPQGLQADWVSASYGTDLQLAFTYVRRHGSVSSLRAVAAPWAALVLESRRPFSEHAVLELWARGSGLVRAAFYLENTKTKRYSK